MSGFIDAHNPLKKHTPSHLLHQSSFIFSKKKSLTSKHLNKEKYVVASSSPTTQYDKKEKLLFSSSFFLLVSCPKQKTPFFFLSLSSPLALSPVFSSPNPSFFPLSFLFCFTKNQMTHLPFELGPHLPLGGTLNKFNPSPTHN